VHVALACLYLACAGIATSVESIAFALLAGYSLLRFWALWRTWVHVVCYPATWALAAWLAWSTLSLLWSPDMDAGLGTLRGSRAMLLLFAIFPVSDRWPLLVSSFLFGLSAQACLQFGQSFGLLEGDPSNPIRHAGLFSHPGYLSTFYAVAIVLALSWAATIWRRRSALLLLSAMALSVAGLGIAAGRGAILGLLVGVPLTAALELRRRLSPMRLAGVCAALPLLLALLVAGVPLALGSQGMTAKIREFRSVAQVTTPSGLRLLYWAASWDAFLERPVAGIGAGGTHLALASTARMRKAESENAGRDPQFFATSQPHSVYVQTLLEQGVIGAVAMATALFAAARLALRRCDDLAIGAGLVGALAIWAVSAAFDALHVSGRTASLACALIALSMGGAAAGAAWRWPERWARRWLEPWLGRLVQRWRARGAAAR
jgi:O-antigen ligase